jgi:hypothetical protein
MESSFQVKICGMKRLILGLLLIFFGVSFWIAAGAVLMRASLVTIKLNRISEKVSGTVEYRYLGIPIFWQQLANVQRVEKREIPITRATPRKIAFGPTKNLTRVVISDEFQNIIAWSEQRGLVEAAEPMQKFLASQETQFTYDEKNIGNTRDLAQDRILDSLFAVTLFVGGVLWFWAAVNQIRWLISEFKSNRSAV